MKKLSKRVTWILAICGILVAGGISWGIYSYIDNKNQITEQETQVANLEKQVDDLYSDNTKELLKADINKKNIEKTEKALDEFKGQDLLTPAITKDIAQIAIDWGNADYMYTYKMQVEKLLDTNGVLRADADIKKVEAQREELIKNTKKETFAKSFDPIVKEANAQQNQIDVANQQVKTLYSNFDKKEVKKDLTWETYNKAKSSVDKVKQAKAKQTLTTNLKPANDALKEADKKEAQAQVKEKAAQEAALASAQEATEESSSSSEKSENSNSGNNGSAASNSSSSEQARESSGSSDNSSSGNSSSGSFNSSGKSASKSSGDSGNSKSSSGSASKNSGGSSSSSSSGTEKGNTWNGTKNDQGKMDSDGGRSWGTIDW